MSDVCIVAVPVVRVRWPYRVWSAVMALAMTAMAAGPWIDEAAYRTQAYSTARTIAWEWWTLGWALGAVAALSAAVWGRRFSWVWSSALALAPAAMWAWCIWWERLAVGTSFPVAALVAWSMFFVAPLWVYAVNRSFVYVIVARPIQDRRR